MTISFGACESSAGSGGRRLLGQPLPNRRRRGHLGLCLLRRLRRRRLRYGLLSAACHLPRPIAPTTSAPQATPPASAAPSLPTPPAPPPTGLPPTAPATSRLSVTSPRAHGTSRPPPSVAGTGGGVSTVIATPSWQTGTGVPSARTGRYTPDVSFSASAHDGYFACMAAVSRRRLRHFKWQLRLHRLLRNLGRRARHGRRGRAARSETWRRARQPQSANSTRWPPPCPRPSTTRPSPPAASAVAASTPPASATTASPAPLEPARQPGFTVGTGYDEATGLGSLDVQVFLNNYLSSTKLTPTVVVVPTPNSITTAQSLSVLVTVNGGTGNPIPTGSVTLTSGSYASAATALAAGSATINVPAGSLAAGTDTLTATYSSDTNYNPETGTATVTVAQGPTFTIAGTAATVTAGATTGNTSTITVAPTSGFTGTVTLTAAVTASPSGAVNAPTFSFGSTSPVSITSGSTHRHAHHLHYGKPDCVLCCRQSSPAWNPLVRAGRRGSGLPAFVFGSHLGDAPGGRCSAGSSFSALTGGIIACGGGKSNPAPQSPPRHHRWHLHHHRHRHLRRNHRLQHHHPHRAIRGGTRSTWEPAHQLRRTAPRPIHACRRTISSKHRSSAMTAKALENPQPAPSKSARLSRARRTAILKALADPRRFELLEQIAEPNARWGARRR